MLATAYRRAFDAALAAMLPYYWICWEAGKELNKRGSNHADSLRWKEPALATLCRMAWREQQWVP